MAQVECKLCGRSLSVPDGRDSVRVRCPYCDGVFTASVPRAEPAPFVPAEPAPPEGPAEPPPAAAEDPLAALAGSASAPPPAPGSPAPRPVRAGMSRRPAPPTKSNAAVVIGIVAGAVVVGAVVEMMIVAMSAGQGASPGPSATPPTGTPNDIPPGATVERRDNVTIIRQPAPRTDPPPTPDSGSSQPPPPQAPARNTYEGFRPAHPEYQLDVYAPRRIPHPTDTGAGIVTGKIINHSDRAIDSLDVQLVLYDLSGLEIPVTGAGRYRVRYLGPGQTAHFTAEWRDARFDHVGNVRVDPTRHVEFAKPGTVALRIPGGARPVWEGNNATGGVVEGRVRNDTGQYVGNVRIAITLVDYDGVVAKVVTGKLQHQHDLAPDRSDVFRIPFEGVFVDTLDIQRCEARALGDTQ